MIRIYALVFIALFVCGCAVNSTDSPKGDFAKSVELKDFEPLIKEAIAQEPINIDELGIKDYSDKDSAEFYDTPQVKILALLKAYQKEHFRFNELLEKLAKDKAQKDFVKYYKIAQRNILLNTLTNYYNADPKKRISYDEFVNVTNSFFDEQGQFITDFGEYFFITLDKMDSISVCKDASCGHGTEMFNLFDIYVNLKEQNKLTDRLTSIFDYGRKGQSDYIRITSANRGLELLGEKLNGENVVATKPSKKQIVDFIEAFDFDGAPEALENFMNFWIKVYLERLYMAKYGMEIALCNECVESIIESHTGVCTFDIYLDNNAKKFCEKSTLLQRVVADFIENIKKPNEIFFAAFDDKMCAIVDFVVLYDERLVDVFTFTLPKIITNPNNKSIMCNGVKEALGGFRTR